MDNAHTVATRRKMLQKWIDDNFEGKQSRFLEDIAQRHPEKPLNQGECSSLLKNKSFGEKKARKIEEQAQMPEGYLDNFQKKVVKKLTDPDALAKYLIQIYEALDDGRRHKLLSFAMELVNESGKVGTVFNPYPGLPSIKEKQIK